MKVLGEYNISVSEGDPSVLGATVTGRTVNYAVAVPGVSEVTLHVYDGAAKQPLYSIRLGEEDRYGDIFSVKVTDAAKGRTYLYEAKGERFLEENKAKEGVEVTESGLQYLILEPGSDVRATSPKDTVTAGSTRLWSMPLCRIRCSTRC